MENNIHEEYARLLERAKSGDDSAFAEIYQKSERLVYTTCYRILNNKENAEDAMQETYLALYNSINTIRDGQALVAWLSRTAYFKSCDLGDKSKNVISYDDAVASEDITEEADDDLEAMPEKYISVKANRDIINNILKNELSKEQYVATFLFYYNELKISEIAEMMHCPENTVKTRLKASKAKIRSSIESYEKINKVSLAGAGAAPFLTRFFMASANDLTLPVLGTLPIPAALGQALNMGAQQGAQIGNIGQVAPQAANFGQSAQIGNLAQPAPVSGASQAGGLGNLAQQAPAQLGSLAQNAGTAGSAAAKAGVFASPIFKVGVIVSALVVTAAVPTAIIIGKSIKDNNDHPETKIYEYVPDESEDNGVTTKETIPSSVTEETNTESAPVYGSTIKFGKYEQDNDTSNGKEDIEWIVLAREGDRILVISRYILDGQPYNETLSDVTWETCSLRKWLNATFLNTAFSDEERGKIHSVTVSADKNPDYDTNPGNSTKDQVFLLSITEANKYFKSDSARQCQATAYCYAQSIGGDGGEENYRAFNWWLRSPGIDSIDAAVVSFNDGEVNASGINVNDDCVAGVRPAMWVNLRSRETQESSSETQESNSETQESSREIQESSSETQESNKSQKSIVSLSEAKPGSIVLFGTYEQDNFTSNGKEDIQWIVLAREGDRILVISRCALDNQPYNTTNASVTWETCSLRKWLNGTFLKDAFSESERAMISSVTVSADKNPHCDTNAGNSTTDQIFLLSITEANKYFSMDSARKCEGTSYCDDKGRGEFFNSSWWLRSPGQYPNNAAVVYVKGAVLSGGYNVDKGFGVRPAMWIDLGS